VAVLSSRAEGMPNAVLEYMAAGRPIVSTAVGAAPQLIHDQVHGLLVPPERPDLLAAAICRLLSDPALATRMGAAARERAQTRYSREVMVSAFETFYRRLVWEGRPHAN
jgi:glycosyltransferase involved in cell wall biosynthesis